MVKNGFLKCKCLEYTENSIKLMKLGADSDETEWIELYIRLASIGTVQKDYDNPEHSTITVDGLYITVDVPTETILNWIRDEE